MYYLIKESLIPCSADEIHRGEAQYAAVLTPAEWQKQRESFGIAIDMEIGALQETKAVVNLDLSNSQVAEAVAEVAMIKISSSPLMESLNGFRLLLAKARFMVVILPPSHS